MSVGGTDFTTALDHAWSWFSLHAAQRIQMLYFWLVAMAFLTAAYVTAMGDGADALAAVIALVGAGASIVFHVLDLRSRQLILIAEAALQELQAQLAESTGIAALQMVEAAAVQHGRWIRYGRVIAATQRTAVVAFLVAALAAAA